MIDILLDHKSNCYSIVTSLTLENYLSIVSVAYESGGGIEGQRSALSTKSARRIRSRMVEDFKIGAVLPPVVIGITSNEIFETLQKQSKNFKIHENIKEIEEERVAIIDGMQRTTAMHEAFIKTENSEDKQNLMQRKIRVEFWITKDTSSLIYRMLVLNTGQVPWNLRRQIEVIMRPLKRELESNIPDLQLISIDDKEYRKAPGAFQADRILELYLIFASRTEKIDSKEHVAEEYARLDIIEASSKAPLIEIYSNLLSRIVRLDKVLWKMEREEDGRFKEGKDFLSSLPVLASLFSILAQHILGRPGWDNESDIVSRRKEKLIDSFEQLLNSLESKNPDEIKEFMDFATLNEIVSQMRGGKVGDTERSFFRGAFRVLIEENFKVPNMGVCWRS